MSDKVKEAIGRLTKVNNKISDAIADGPEGSFKECLLALEEQVAMQNEYIYSTIELLKEVDELRDTIEVTVGVGMEPDEWESYLERGDEIKFRELVKHETKTEEDEEGVKFVTLGGLDWTFNMPKDEARALYHMLQVLAGLHVQLMWNQDLGFEPMEIIKDGSQVSNIRTD